MTSPRSPAPGSSAAYNAGALDSDRMIVWTLRPPPVTPPSAAMLQRLIRTLIVDEFQDAYPAQTGDRFSPRRAEERRPDTTRLMLVGDPKQSIYCSAAPT